MKRTRLIFGLLLLALPTGCAQQPGLPPVTAAVPATTSSLPKSSENEPADATFIVASRATDAYSAVARGALNCWFGANGPMRNSHIFGAEAAPEANGGAAEIVVRERDASLPDQRGVRAFRVSFVPTAGGTQVMVAHLKIEAPAAPAMLQDVENWARGGTGCALRTVMPPVPDAAPALKTAKIRTTR